jgi:subtilisin family serine protease
MSQQRFDVVKVPEEWILSGGKGITIGVIDSDICVDTCDNVVKKYRINNNGISKTSHCDSVCNIISKVAPFCKIIVSQAINGKVGTYDCLTRAIDNILNDDVDIVNFSLSSKEDKDIIRTRIEKLSEKSIIIASMANNGSKSFPAEYDCVVSVSSFKKSDINADIYCNDSFIFGNNKTKKTGNSMSTAFVSGIFALAKSYNKNYTKDDIIKQLLGK